MTRAQLNDWVDDLGLSEEPLLVPDGFEHCIIGVCEQFNRIFLVFDRTAVIETLMAGGMEEDEAEEYYSFNIVGAWVGDATPGFVTRCPS